MYFPFPHTTGKILRDAAIRSAQIFCQERHYYGIQNQPVTRPETSSAPEYPEDVEHYHQNPLSLS